MKIAHYFALAAVVLVSAAVPVYAAGPYRLTDLGDLPSSGNTSSEDMSFGYGMNNSARAVGYSWAMTSFRAFLWTSGVGMRELGDLPGGANRSGAEAINNVGEVVGYSGASTGERAFLWTNGVI